MCQESELSDPMLNSWFTIVAQVINFLILVWLLKRFLYKPILAAIDAREKGIAARLADAAKNRALAQQEGDDFRSKMELFDREREGLTAKAVASAAVERQRLIGDAQKEVDDLRAKGKHAIQTDQDALTKDITDWTQREVFAITKKTLEDLVGPSFNECMTEVFVYRLRQLTGTPKDRLTAALKLSPNKGVIRVAVDLPVAQQAKVEAAIKELFDVNAQVRFETSSDLISGIELSIGGQKIAWSIAEYLKTLERSISSLLSSRGLW